MIKNLVSVIIPSRGGQPYLQSTVTGLLNNAREDIEIIVVCDGIWPDPLLLDDKRVIIVHHGTQFNSRGMKEGIMQGIAIARGEYIMKTDEHTMFDEGWDVKLKADCEDNWVVIPRRHRLLGDEWELEEYTINADGSLTAKPGARPPVDYMYLSYPYERPFDKTCGLHGAEWRDRYYARKDILIDDTMSMQGSCYFMKRSWWDNVIKGFDVETFGNFTMEAQEIGNKTWYSGGRVVVNKKTWYAHMHKGKRGKRYQFSNQQYDSFMRQNEKGRLAGIRIFIQDPQFEVLLKRFWPVPTWPENWKERLVLDEKQDYSHSEGYNSI
jgi:glycosyltransferase involved in cell wall biosynthesis